MKQFISRSTTTIGRQLVFIIAGMILLALLSNAFFQFYKEKQRALQTLTQQGQSLSHLLANIAIEPLLIYDNSTINELVKNASSQNNVIYTIFLDRQGNAITQHLNNELKLIKQAVDASQSDDVSLILKQLQSSTAMLHFSQKVEFESIHLASVYIGLDKKSLVTTPLYNLYIQVSSSLGFGLMMGIGIYIGILRRVSRPIEILSQSARDISQLKFDTDINIKGNNEISDLANTLNQMRLALKNAEVDRIENISIMEQLNSSLEDRVKERTNKLEILNTQITHQAMHDPLTGLPNRTLIIKRLNQAIDDAARHNKRLAVFILDLNNFKEINDTLGHPEGDVILKQVARRIPEALGSNDTIGRLGGDEFAVVLPDTDQLGAVEVAKKIVRILQPGFELKSHIIDINASIGVAIYPEHGDDQTALIRHADVAMYEGKRNGRNICVYSSDFDNNTPWRLALMADLRQAIEDNRLELFYQPQLDLRNNTIYGVEALLRWDHEIQGYISPDQFIYIAENSGLIQPLTRWVLNQALYQWRKWKDQGVDIDMSINISARNLNDPKLADRLYDLLQQYNVTIEKIKLEFTESAIMANPETVLNLMQDPKLKGLRYAIDDFGTGYSSLSYLKRLPVDEVKIDKSFVNQMNNNDDDASIVNSVIDLAHNLGHQVVAEGVETEVVKSMLMNRGCDSVQGFLLSQAIRADDIPGLLGDYHSENETEKDCDVV